MLRRCKQGRGFLVLPFFRIAKSFLLFKMLFRVLKFRRFSMLQDLAVGDLQTAVFDALVRGDEMLWLKDGKDISGIKVSANCISDEAAFVKFPRKDSRRGFVIKEANFISLDEFNSIAKIIYVLPSKLQSDADFFKTFPGHDKMSIETIYTISGRKFLPVYINKPFTGIFDKLYIMNASYGTRPWFEVAFRKKNTKIIYVTANELLVDTFLKLPSHKTYKIYLDGCMAFSKGGFKNKSDRKFVYLYSIYQLD
jgi:hypothetical protein